jgi:anaerobic magnesium-protoporphyrin IX monomethyl ester cyclase
MATLQKVAFINPPYFPRYSRSQRSPGVIKSGTMYYPYWLAHCAAVLDSKGHDIYLYDCPAANTSLEALLTELKEYQPKLCVLESSTASSKNDLEVAAKIRELLPDSLICMVGTHATALWKEMIESAPHLDFVAIGEYDYIILDLLEAIGLQPKDSSKDYWKQIAGLGFRNSEGKADRGPVRPPIENVDELPWIAPIYKRFLKTENYYFSLASYPMVMLIGGRGCVAKCTYCVYPQVMHGHHYRTRTPRSIVGEMKWIQENLPEVKEIVFEDDTFTGDREFAREVAQLVSEMKVHLPWFANVRTNVDKETLGLMKKAGFRCCATGFESGDDVLLKNMWKGQTVKGQKIFVEDCKALGILVHGCFMFGFPGETQETMKKTLQLAIDLSPDSAQFYPVMPFPGTTYYIWAKQNGYLATDKFENWVNHEGGHRCVLNLPGLSAEQIEKFCEKAYLKFYFRPKYIWFKLKQAFGSIYEGIRSIKSFYYFIIYLLTNKRKITKPFVTPSLPVPPDWHSVQKMPKGRMFEQETELGKKELDATALAQKKPNL